MKDKVLSFTDLVVWQEGHKLILLVYQLTKDFPKDELLSLTNQMKRASVSITSNIAEGFGRHGYKEKLQFYYLAHGSLTELNNQMIIAKDIGYLNQKNYLILSNQLETTHRLLLGFISKTKSYI